MTPRTRIPSALVLVLALLLLPAAVAPADQAYDKVAAAYAQSGGQLDPCAFSTAELQAAIAGIPPQIKDVVPDLRKAMQDGIEAHRRGSCKGKHATSGNGTAAPPAVTTTPTTPTVTAPAPVTPAPAATAPQTTPTTPAPTTTTTTQTQSAPADTGRDRTPLLIALIAVGGLLLLGLLLWGWARLRGWDPTWTSRWRQAWGEAGFRTSATWSEFADWLRLGR